MTSMQPDSSPPEDEPPPETPPRPASVDVNTAVDLPRMADGTVIVYFEPSPSGADSFRRATVIGPEIADPQTNAWWAPVRLPDRTLELLPSTLVVDRK